MGLDLRALGYGLFSLGASTFGAVEGMAQDPANVATPQAPTLSYEVDASLIYFDALSRPRTGAIAPQAAAAAAPTRTLGLQRLRLAATWQAMDSAGLTIVLRPDAVNRSLEESGGGEARELDTRAGEVALGNPYRSEPTIRLLDAYQLNIAPGAALSASFGVFEELATDVASYPELLGFGLETRLPAKFSGARLGWRKSRPTDDKSGAGLAVELTVMQGDDDRAEGRCESQQATLACSGDPSSRDHGPVARDPYQGAAVETSWVGTSGLRLSALVGSLDAASNGGRVSEVLGQVGVESTSTVFGRVMKNSFDVRYARERWRVDGVSIRPRLQYSARLTTALAVDARAFWLLGLALGHSDQDPGLPASAPRSFDEQIPVDGYQIETGYLATIAPSLSAQLMLTHEHRTSEDAAGDETGGIYHTDGNSRTLRRMGLALIYTLNDDA